MAFIILVLSGLLIAAVTADLSVAIAQNQGETGTQFFIAHGG
jgi:hypothetical protein